MLDTFTLFMIFCCLCGSVWISSGRLTPPNDAELQDVPADVGVKDFDQSDVHMDRF